MDNRRTCRYAIGLGIAGLAASAAALVLFPKNASAKTPEKPPRYDGPIWEAGTVTGYILDGQKLTLADAEKLTDADMISWYGKPEKDGRIPLYLSEPGSPEPILVCLIDMDRWAAENLDHWFSYQLESGLVSDPDGNPVMYVIDGKPYSLSEMEAYLTIGMSHDATENLDEGILEIDKDGYRFREEDGTHMSHLYSLLEDAVHRPGVSRLFGKEWEYIGRKGEPGADIDIKDRKIIFYMERDITELPDSVILSILKAAQKTIAPDKENS